MEDEKTLAQMLNEAKTKKSPPKPRVKKPKTEEDENGYTVHQSLQNKTVEEVAKLTPIMMAKLSVACQERDNFEGSLAKTQKSLFKSKDKHIELLGRLYKHEGEPIIREALEYAEENGLFIQCDSKLLGIFTEIKTLSQGRKYFLAHMSHYCRMIKKAKKDDVPESYKGNFLYKEFKPQFDKLLKKSVKSFTCMEDLFHLSEGSPI